ncbi:hypothetical protein INT47_012735 [Mucor saturninus]|uniref:HCP-like protein n=1 Tax=Mucor saturninus TaxID=64648 RepID=A0A8H7R4Q0_9FUNG|nr:hypothetical protein INT47_012735 [Mucor saturninus]
MIPAPSATPYHVSKNDMWRQPARTSSLQKAHHLPRESLIDPNSNEDAYSYQNGGYARETYIDPAAVTIDSVTEDYMNTTSYIPNSPANMNYFHHQQHYNGYPLNKDPEIQMVTPPKSVKSNVQYYVEELPVKAHQSFIKPSNVHASATNFALQPVPHNKKNNNYSNSTSPLPTVTKSSNTIRLPKPPLTPLVIPPTPIRSSSSPNRGTPTRSSSIQNIQLTPGSMTPGSSRSMNSPHSGLSPYTPSTPSPLPSLGYQKQETTKKHSLLPEGEAEQYVHEGIKFHEMGKLEKATEMFKQASMLDFPMGMFLYGVSLRHGWGCAKNEHLAFQYLQKSAEHAVVDLNRFSSSMNTSATKGELIMAIYELGVSFRHGWGCKKNKETAVYYFKIAADLNDADAQNDLGHCYYHGHGVKKDMMLAAKYYRLADKQGQGIMGNSWIWKSKYDPPSHIK